MIVRFLMIVFGMFSSHHRCVVMMLRRRRGSGRDHIARRNWRAKQHRRRGKTLERDCQQQAPHD